jgi:L-fuconolactonase
VEVVDAQLHCWEPDNARRPWNPAYGAKEPSEAANRAHLAAHPLGYDELLRWMDGAGVDAGLLVTIAPYAPEDNSYALEAAVAHPDRFAVVGRIDTSSPDLETKIAGWRTAGMVGLRQIIVSEAEVATFRTGGYDRLFAACERHQVPLCVYPRILPELRTVAARHRGLQLVIDHVGLAQPPLMPAETEPFGRLPQLLALADLPNIAVKLTGLPSLSAEGYPFADVWPALMRLLDAFSPERVLWGSDATRTAPLHSYRDGVRFIREHPDLDRGTKTLLLGGALRRLFRWPRA